MNSRERVFTALAHEETDRPPISATYTPEIEQKFRERLNNYEEDLGYLLGNDLIKVAVGLEKSYHYSDAPTYECPFGITWRNISNYTGSYTEIVKGPLEDDENADKLSAYKIPSPHNQDLYTPVKKTVDQYAKDHFIIGSCQCSLFETAWYLHGLEDTLCDLLVNEDYMDQLLDKIMEFPLYAGLNMIDSGVDMVWLGDDIATQLNEMMSLDVWRKYFKPRYSEIFSKLKEKKKNIVLAYHSCGNCQAFLDDFIEIGLDVLNPIQPLAMNPYEIKKRYGKQLTLFGALDIQELMPRGTKSQIAFTIRSLKKYLGADGGYILSPAHHFQSDTSLDRIELFYEVAKEITKYDHKYLK
jgi:uroporphyrinogen decarboxylase